ncbi:MAG: hypothetical protein PVSMB4_00330 [Ktedonobacterales bacterium]
MAYALGGLIALGTLAGVVGLVQFVPAFAFPESLLLLALAGVSFLWGSGPGLLASVLMAALTAAISIPASSPFALGRQEDAAGVALLLTLGCIISLIAGGNERARRTALEGSERMDQLLHLVSHELRNPLTSLNASLQLALRQTQVQAATPEEQAAHLERAAALLVRTTKQVDRMNRLISDLMETARVGMDKLELRLAPCELGAVVREALESQRETVPTRTIHLQAPDTPVVVLADTDRLAQVITNYLSNALKYSPEDQPVEIIVQADDTEARIGVRDQGPGLSPAQQCNLWQRGYRAPGIKPQASSGGNLGLGLYVSRMLIESQGGRVGVESAPGHGSTFWCSLPLAQGPAACARLETPSFPE